MLQKRKARRVRKPLALERLEDRLVLSGNVTVFQDTILGSGRVFINGDNGNNAIQINQTNNLGFPTLSIRGSFAGTTFAPGNVTAINSIPGGVANIPLASVTEIDITEGNGTNTILLGNVTGFSIPGNINITVGTGVDTISLKNISTNAGVINITGLGTSKDTISETNVIAGKSVITTGSRDASVTQTNVTLGFDFITTGAGNDTIKILDSRFNPPPRTYAIGLLILNTDNGNDNININNISVGPSFITAGAGNNTVKFDGSTIQQADITIGSETPGVQGSNTVDVSNDIITGAHLNVSVLNQSGISGVLANGNPGTPLTTAVVNTVTMNNVQFTGGGDLNLRVDDGSSYFNAGNNTNIAASTVVMTLIDTTGNVTVTVGDNFALVEVGQGTPGLNDIDANNLTVSAGNNLDVVIVSALLTGRLAVTLGNVTPNPPPMPAMVLINGTSAQADIRVGNNTNTGLVTGWPINISETVKGHDAYNGSLTFNGGNGLALNITNTSVSNSMFIDVGSGGVNHFESVNLSKVTVANDLSIILHSDVLDVPDTVPAGAYVTLDTVTVGNTTPKFAPILGPSTPPANFFLQDQGSGVDIVSLTNVNVVYGLYVLLSNNSNMNVLSAQNVTAAFGQIDGGLPGTGNLYQDLGGNYGYFVTDFAGH